MTTLPTDPKARKDIPIGRGFFDYFPAAIAEVAKVSKAGNDQHNPGEEIHWARGKSTDQIDTILRHLMERGSVDTDGQRHTAKAAWRVLALLQLELEAAGAPVARGARLPAEPTLEETCKAVIAEVKARRVEDPEFTIVYHTDNRPTGPHLRNPHPSPGSTSPIKDEIAKREPKLGWS